MLPEPLLRSIDIIEALFIKEVPSAVLRGGERCFKTEICCVKAHGNEDTDAFGGSTTLLSSLFQHLSDVFDPGHMEYANTDSEHRAVVFRFKACAGLFWVIALSSCPNTRLNPVQHINSSGASAVGIRHTECSEGCESYVIVALILPYTCLQCGVWAPTMRKCERCWHRAGVCMRYCGKECQREHFPKHRGVCGMCTLHWHGRE